MLLPHGRVIATSLAQLKDMLLMQVQSITGYEEQTIDWE